MVATNRITRATFTTAAFALLLVVSGCSSQGDSTEARLKDAGYTADMLIEETVARLKNSTATGEVTKVKESNVDPSHGSDPSSEAGRKDPKAVSTIVEDTALKLTKLRTGEPAPKDVAQTIEMKVQAEPDIGNDIKKRFLSELRTLVDGGSKDG